MNATGIKKYGWAKPRTNDFVVHAKREKGIQTVCAVAEFGLVALESIRGTFNAKLFSKFIVKVLANLHNIFHRHNSNIILFWDNAPTHKALVTQRKINQLQVKVLANCPYTPELNAAELFIRAHKLKVRKQMSVTK